MIHFLKTYFTFTRAQRNGVFVLLALMLVLLALPYALPLFMQQEKTDFTAFQEEIAAFESQVNALEEKHAAKEAAAPELFEFNPNELDEDGWEKLGVSGKTIRTIINYRKKGGHFYAADDLLKIYGFDTAQYARLAPFIRIDDAPLMNPLEATVYRPKQQYAQKANYPATEKKRKVEPRRIELNAADSAQLVAINGIGPTLSRRIIKYRNRLGGFVHPDQLLEVYGMDSVRLETIAPSLFIDTGFVVKIFINKVSSEELQQHPYFRQQHIANAVCNYRQQHGVFAGVDDLKKIYALDETLLRKAAPYLSFE